jgi:hypothetical protein
MHSVFLVKSGVTLCAFILPAGQYELSRGNPWSTCMEVAAVLVAPAAMKIASRSAVGNRQN